MEKGRILYSLGESGLNEVIVVSNNTAKEKLKEGAVDITKEVSTYEDLISGTFFGGVDYLFNGRLSELPVIRKMFGYVPLPVGEPREDEDCYGRKEYCQYFTDSSYRKVGA